MTFADFIESVLGRLRKGAADASRSSVAFPSCLKRLGRYADVVQLIERAPMFVLGDADEMLRVITDRGLEFHLSGRRIPDSYTFDTVFQPRLGTV